MSDETKTSRLRQRERVYWARWREIRVNIGYLFGLNVSCCWLFESLRGRKARAQIRPRRPLRVGPFAFPQNESGRERTRPFKSAIHRSLRGSRGRCLDGELRFLGTDLTNQARFNLPTSRNICVHTRAYWRRLFFNYISPPPVSVRYAFKDKCDFSNACSSYVYVLRKHVFRLCYRGHIISNWLCPRTFNYIRCII